MEMTTEWVVARIDKLRNESHISEYKLCQRAGIGTSTISSMRIRKTWPKVQTMIAICEALDVTLSDFFKTEEDSISSEDLSKQERELISFSRGMAQRDKEALIKYAEAICIAAKEKHKKE